MAISATETGPDAHRRSLLALAAIGPALAIGLRGGAASAQTDRAMPPELARAWDAYNRATIRKDVAALAGLVTDDYMLVNSDASVQDKSSYLADFNAPGFTLEPYQIEAPFHRIWGDTALTGGLFDLSWTQDGRHQRRRLRIAHVWTKANGHWRIAFSQLTRAQPPRRAR